MTGKEPPNREAEINAIYVHEAFDMGMKVDVSRVAEILDMLDEIE